MGGNAFAAGPEALFTPRMSPGLYNYMRQHLHSILHNLFAVVATPIEGPEKEDYGDIDIFVAWEMAKCFPNSDTLGVVNSTSTNPMEAAKILMGAEKAICNANGRQAHFAIPWPQDLPEDVEDSAEEANKPKYIQVDLHICETLERLEWHLFKHAHGDLWNLLGSTIRPFGLTIDDVGLHLRIPEIEKIDKKKSKIFLSDDPIEVLQFIGLKIGGKEWAEHFDTMEDAFEYAATCRLFWVRPETDTESVVSDDEITGGSFERSRLKSNDRRRMNTRPMFRKWIDEFLPKCRREGRFTRQRVTKEQVRLEAFEKFGIVVQRTYERRLFEFQKQRQLDHVWKDIIKGGLPMDGVEPQFRSCAAAAMKKIVLSGDTSFGITPPCLRDQNGMFMEDEVRRFVRTSWREVGQVAWEQNQERYRQHLAHKRTASGQEKISAS